MARNSSAREGEFMISDDEANNTIWEDERPVGNILGYMSY